MRGKLQVKNETGNTILLHDGGANIDRYAARYIIKHGGSLSLSTKEGFFIILFDDGSKVDFTGLAFDTRELATHNHKVVSIKQEAAKYSIAFPEEGDENMNA